MKLVEVVIILVLFARENKKVEERYCIGMYNLNTLSYLPCPNNCKLDFNSKMNNCGECYNKIGFNPAFYNTQKISPQQLEYNKLPHVVYLAYFPLFTLKLVWLQKGDYHFVYWSREQDQHLFSPLFQMHIWLES